jgi:hypothetical protein
MIDQNGVNAIISIRGDTDSNTMSVDYLYNISFDDNALFDDIAIYFDDSVGLVGKDLVNTISNVCDKAEFMGIYDGGIYDDTGETYDGKMGNLLDVYGESKDLLDANGLEVGFSDLILIDSMTFNDQFSSFDDIKVRFDGVVMDSETFNKENKSSQISDIINNTVNWNELS